MEKYDDFDFIYPAENPHSIIKMKELIAYCKANNKELKDLTPEEGDRFIVENP